MSKRQYSVVSTSGWEGDGLRWQGTFDTRKEAEELRRRIVHPDAKFDGYMTAIIGDVKVCDMHDFCYIGDTSRTDLPRHLCSRRTHLSDASMR